MFVADHGGCMVQGIGFDHFNAAIIIVVITKKFNYFSTIYLKKIQGEG